YTWTFTANTGAPPYAFTVSAGALPGGLSLNGATGVLAGTPTTTAGSPFGFTIRATNGSGFTQQAFSVAVTQNPVRIITGILPDGAIGDPYEQTIEVVGGLGPTFNWSIVTGSLPAPLAITGTGRVATIIGTPGSNGVSSFTVRVQDATGGAIDTQAYTMAVASGGIGFAPTSAPTPPAGTLGQPFS